MYSKSKRLFEYERMASATTLTRGIVNSIYIIFILFGVAIPVCSGCPGDECRIIQFKEPIPNKAMMGHVIKKEEVPNQRSCRIVCYMEPNCVSINVGPLVGGKQICELNNATVDNQDANALHNKMNYMYLGIENPCSSSPCFNNGTCQVGYTAKGFCCKCDPRFTGTYCGEACNFDFETGIDGWEKTGTVFNNQPTFGDNPSARNREPAKQQGDWWIGGAEHRPYKNITAGKLQGGNRPDIPQGTLTSTSFRIIGKNISFLIGGGCDITLVRAELIVNNQVVRNVTGYCSETMHRKSWNVENFIGQHARVRLIDFSSGSWGHINFDDLTGDIICEKDYIH